MVGYKTLKMNDVELHKAPHDTTYNNVYESFFSFLSQRSNAGISLKFKMVLTKGRRCLFFKITKAAYGRDAMF